LSSSNENRPDLIAAEKSSGSTQETVSTSVTQIAVYPPAHIVKAFAEVLPGSPERLLKMLEDGQKANVNHQNAWLQLQAEALGQRRRDIRWGQLAGVGTLAVIVATACVMILHGVDWRFCTALLGLPLAGIITALITAHKSNNS
jgi:uncharacterized membrane protein